ncbi:MAG: SDR family oxidoreductase [Acidobacteriota bacterium]|nr:SDR family oxidoreductase [Acidobacteriota bacterium]MDQ7088798.1 SDR family oxidoreductase [Acidobacteriota bacterium]
MPTVLVTGASRGLGFEFVRQYAAEGWRVVATCRRPEAAERLGALASRSPGSVSLHSLDVASPAAITDLAAELGETAIDLLINNAGVYPPALPLGQIDYPAWEQAFRVNTLAPVRMVEAFLPALARARAPRVANITSKMGSIADNTSGGSYAYRASKTALNMVTANLAHDLRERGITVLGLHPGWVATAMGGAGAPLDVETSVAGMRRVIAAAKSAHSGRFLAYDGSEIPW